MLTAKHTNRVCKDFGIKNLDKYHDLYLKSHTLLLAVFENFRKMCLEIYKLDPARFLSVPGLAWQASLKETKAELELLTDIMLLMVEKRIRWGICLSINRYTKANNKSMKDYDKNKELIYMVGQCRKSCQ